MYARVCGGDIMGCLPPDLFVCARASAGCVVCEEEKEETASCAHATTKNTEIYLNCMYSVTLKKKSFQVLIH